MKWARVAVAFVVVMMTIAATRADAAEPATDAPPVTTLAEDEPPPVPVIGPAILHAAGDLARMDRQLAEVEQQIADANRKLASAQAALSVYQGFVVTSTPGVERARQKVVYDAVTAYVNHSAASGVTLTLRHGEDVGRADRYLAASTAVDMVTVSQLLAMQQRLEQLRSDGATLRDNVSAAVSALQEAPRADPFTGRSQVASDVAEVAAAVECPRLREGSARYDHVVGRYARRLSRQCRRREEPMTR